MYTLGLGVCAGIAAAFLFGAGFFLAALFLLLALAALACAALDARLPAGRQGSRSALLLLALALAALTVGLARANIFLNEFSQQNITLFENKQPVVVAGTVVDNPDRRPSTVHANVEVWSVDASSARGELVAFLPAKTDIAYGETVQLHGVIEKPKVFMGDAGNEFDYPGYLKAKNVSAVLSSATVVHTTPAGFSLFGALYKLRAAFNASIERMLPEPEGSLLEGMLLGERRGLSPDVQELLVSVGLIHIVILAGYALSLVADGVLRVAKVLPKRARLPVVALFLILYVLMTGASPSTVRAATMAIIAVAARYLGRTAVALRSLCLAAAGMALWNPPILLHDTSFIVSVVATFGLITLGSSVQKWLRWVPEKFELRQIAASTVSVQLFTTPALLYFTGNLSSISVPANLLALPALPWAMLFGFFAAILHFISPVLSFAPLVVVYALLRYILFVAQTAASIPFGSTVLYAFPSWLAIAIYVPFTAIALRLYRKKLTNTDIKGI